MLCFIVDYFYGRFVLLFVFPWSVRAVTPCAVAMVAGLLWWLLHARTVACGRLCTPRYIKILCLITEYIEPVLEDPTLALFKYIITVCSTYC